MKKIMVAFMTIMLAAFMVTGASAKTVLKGDINQDGRITAADARLTLRVSAKLETCTDSQLLIADVSGDGKITASDARSILRCAANIGDKFGEIEIDETEDESTTQPDIKTEVSANIGKVYDDVADKYGELRKGGASGGIVKYSNNKITFVSDPSIISDGKFSSIVISDSQYTLNGVFVGMTSKDAVNMLKANDWVVKEQSSSVAVLTDKMMFMELNIADGDVTKIEYGFAQSLITPEETTTKAPVDEETTTQAPETDEPTTGETTTNDTSVEETTTSEPTTKPHEHKYMVTEKPANCTQGGYKEYLCTCGHSYRTDETEAKGHSYATPIITEPTCTTGGYSEYVCTTCFHTYKGDEKAALGHNEVWTVLIPAGPGAVGLEQSSCTVCDEILGSRPIPATDLPEGQITYNELPEQAKAFVDGEFGIIGYNYSEGKRNPISMYVSHDHIKAGMSLDNMKLDILIRDIKGKSTTYLIRPDLKKYSELSAFLMTMIGINPDDLQIDFSTGTENINTIKKENYPSGNINYIVYTIDSGAEYCKIYTIEDTIDRIETYNSSTKVMKTRIDVTTFIADLPADTFTLDQYKKESFFTLFGGLAQ